LSAPKDGTYQFHAGGAVSAQLSAPLQNGNALAFNSTGRDNDDQGADGLDQRDDGRRACLRRQSKKIKLVDASSCEG
jgi:hypothetical protein